MSRYTLRKVCAEPGCKAVAFFGYETQRELRESTYRNRDWLCTRHAYPDELLSAGNPMTERVMVSARAADKLYWDGTSGLTFGPGFKAFADDFPEGSRLIVTARIELPTDGAMASVAPSSDAKDAARWRWWRAKDRLHIQTETEDAVFSSCFECAEDFEAAVDEAMAADGVKGLDDAQR